MLEKITGEMSTSYVNLGTVRLSKSWEAEENKTNGFEPFIPNYNTMTGDELEYTARLRIENDSASLSELAALHEPPISKSGLNSRLSKILAIAERHKNI